MARQDPRYKDPEEGKAAKRTYSTKACTTKMEWTGHVTTMPDERLPKKVFYGELQEGKCSQGGQKKRFNAPLKHRLRISTFQLSPGNRLHRIEQSGVASSTKELHSLKQ